MRTKTGEGQFSRGLPKPVTDQPRLVDPADTTAPLPDRAKAWLATNCSHCHLPEGGGNSAMNLSPWASGATGRFPCPVLFPEHSSQHKLLTGFSGGQLVPFPVVVDLLPEFLPRLLVAGLREVQQLNPLPFPPGREGMMGLGRWLGSMLKN